MNDSVIRITLDTNCVINLFDRSSETATSMEALTTLIRYGLSSKVEIAATTRVEADLLKDKNPDRQGEILRMLEMIPIVGSIGRMNTSKWGDGDVWAGKDMTRLETELQQMLFPGLKSSDKHYSNKVNDVDHLIGHLLNRRDVFVTDDSDMLRRKDQLKSGPGLVVMTPADCVKYIDEIEHRQRPQTFPSDGLNPQYHTSALKGQVTFDYSNNNHRFAIGEGHFFFETRWSSASEEAIYAYTDSESISALALAKTPSEISLITDVSGYDYSSRVRAPKLGQIVIWRNVNGLYAATKIIDIKCDDRSSHHDELTFEYVILPDGSGDFSKA